jgi:hypothetical protein
MPRQIRTAAMKNNRGEATFRKFAAYIEPGTSVGNRAVINRKRTISMLKAIIRYLNFNGNAPIIIHRYEMNNKIKMHLRQRWDLFRGVE